MKIAEISGQKYCRTSVDPIFKSDFFMQMLYKILKNIYKILYEKLLDLKTYFAVFYRT